MKFSTNKKFEGKEIEVKKISTGRKQKTNRELLQEILEKIKEHDKILLEYRELFKKHGWIN